MTDQVILDASAVLAVLRREPGADKVVPHLNGGQLSTVNYVEVVSKSLDVGIPSAATQGILTQLGIERVPFDDRHAIATAELRLPTQAFGVSLADRACLALAVVTGLKVLTADKRWTEIGLPVDIQTIR